MENQPVIAGQFETSDMNEPHFEEEWTVLSARQVVPIADLEAKQKRKFSLKLFGSFLLASSLGVVVALAAIRLRERYQSPSETSVPASEESSGESNLMGGDTATVPAEQTAEAEAELESTESVSSSTVDKPARRTEKADQNVAVDFEDDANDAAPAVDSDGSSKPRPRLVEQWQEGRPRRVQQQRRRANDGDAHHPRDLRDLEEIFEGSRP